MICQKCNCDILAGDEVSHKGQLLCEDCYIEMLEPPRTCDVAAVYSAKMARQAAGQEGTDGLTEQQKAVYEYIKDSGPVTHDQIIEQFQLTRMQLDKIFPILRHCELVRAFREDGKVFVTVWTPGGPGEISLERGV